MLELACAGCTVYVQPSNIRENLKPRTHYNPHDKHFSMLDVIGLRRAILHKLGRAILSNLYDFRGIGLRPIMLGSIDPNNLPESVAELDAYYAWLAHSYCRDKSCPLMVLRVPNKSGNVHGGGL